MFRFNPRSRLRVLALQLGLRVLALQLGHTPTIAVVVTSIGNFPPHYNQVNQTACTTPPWANFPCSISPDNWHSVGAKKGRRWKRLAESFPKTRRSALAPSWKTVPAVSCTRDTPPFRALRSLLEPWCGQRGARIIRTHDVPQNP